MNLAKYFVNKIIYLEAYNLKKLARNDVNK